MVTVISGLVGLYSCVRLFRGVVVYLVGMACGLGWWFGCLFDVANYCFGYGFLLGSLACCCILWLFVFDCVLCEFGLWVCDSIDLG